MKAYKGFNKDLTCRGFQYEEGKTYETNEAKLCEKGFHACVMPLDCFAYYTPSKAVYHAVELENVSAKTDSDSKRVAKKITIGRPISLIDMANKHVSLILECISEEKSKSNTGDQSAATNTGYRSAATNTGYRSAATNAGSYSAATNTGSYSAATNTGSYSAATNTGYRSAATNTGYRSAATNTGDRSAATNTGYRSAATNTGYQSAATNTGYRSAAEVGGKDSVAIVTGYKSKAKGAIDCWLVLTERDEDMKILDIKTYKVDGDKVKADTWYMLENGELVEVTEV